MKSSPTDKRATWRPKEQRETQNEEILEAFRRGETRNNIAARLGITRNTVIGVISRARNNGDPRVLVEISSGSVRLDLSQS